MTPLYPDLMKFPIPASIFSSTRPPSCNVISYYNNHPLLHHLYLGPQVVGRDPHHHLQQEDDAQQPGEGEGHAVALVDSTTASEEGDTEDDDTKDDEEDRSGEMMTKEVKILTVG